MIHLLILVQLLSDIPWWVWLIVIGFIIFIILMAIGSFQGKEFYTECEWCGKRIIATRWEINNGPIYCSGKCRRKDEVTYGGHDKHGRSMKHW